MTKTNCSLNSAMAATKATFMSNTTKKYKKAPGAPKRFKSAYMFYSEQEHKRIRAMSHNKKIRAAEVAKMVSHRWKTMSDAERWPWLEKGRLDRARYEREKAAYSGPWKVAVPTTTANPIVAVIPSSCMTTTTTATMTIMAPAATKSTPQHDRSSSSCSSGSSCSPSTTSSSSSSSSSSLMSSSSDLEQSPASSSSSSSSSSSYDATTAAAIQIFVDERRAVVQRANPHWDEARVLYWLIAQVWPRLPSHTQQAYQQQAARKNDHAQPQQPPKQQPVGQPKLTTTACSTQPSSVTKSSRNLVFLRGIYRFDDNEMSWMNEFYQQSQQQQQQQKQHQQRHDQNGSQQNELSFAKLPSAYGACSTTTMTTATMISSSTIDTMSPQTRDTTCVKDEYWPDEAWPFDRRPVETTSSLSLASGNQNHTPNGDDNRDDVDMILDQEQDEEDANALYLLDELFTSVQDDVDSLLNDRRKTEAIDATRTTTWAKPALFTTKSETTSSSSTSSLSSLGRLSRATSWTSYLAW